MTPWINSGSDQDSGLDRLTGAFCPLERAVGDTMKFVGYVVKLPIQSGDEITIRKGALVWSRGEVKPAGRTFKVKVHHVLNGYGYDAAEQAYQERHGREPAKAVNPKVVWAGSGGYWCEVDMNDIPEAQESA